MFVVLEGMDDENEVNVLGLKYMNEAKTEIRGLVWHPTKKSRYFGIYYLFIPD